MREHEIADSSFTVIINTTIDKVDLPTWCFSRPEREYQRSHPAHIAAGSATAQDGKRMSFNVEIISGSLLVHHYVETIGRKDHLILNSNSDLFTQNGRTSIHVTWELSVRDAGPGKCEFTNRVSSYATEETLVFLARHGILFDQFRAQRQIASVAHNQDGTPRLAASIERASLKK